VFFLFVVKVECFSVFFQFAVKVVRFVLLLWVLVVRGDGGNELPLDGDIQGGC
jgi:hypothetical protein